MGVERLHDVSLEEVAQRMAAGQVNSQADLEARAEFLRRQTLAAQETADATKRYTKYMFWSVVVLAASAVATLVIEIVRLF
jgi:anti-sigma-K factor RskA